MCAYGHHQGILQIDMHIDIRFPTIGVETRLLAGILVVEVPEITYLAIKSKVYIYHKLR